MKIAGGKWLNPVIALIILLSFFTFSENYYPLLTSDMAVNILMTPSFSLPHDIYFWGQDRSGNLIPMIAHAIYILSGWQPVVIVSIVHYLLLAAGFLALMRFVKSEYSRVILALVWFFPPWHFLEFLLILYGIQTSLVLISLNFLDRSFTTRVRWKCLAWLSASCFMFIVAVWVSDMALGSLLALILTALLYFFSAAKDIDKKISLNGMMVPAILLLTWAVAGYLVLHHVKVISTPVQNYTEGFLAAPASVAATIKAVGVSVLQTLLFSSDSQIESVYAWGLAASLILLVFSIKKHARKSQKITENPWLYFFLLEAILTLAAVLLSRWVAANGAGRRYFTTFFMSSWICLILWLENQPKNKWKKSVQIALSVVVIAGSISGCFRFYYPEIKPSRIRVISAFKSMGDIGIIAEYWNAYMAASPDPVHIKATPHDKDYARNPDMVNEVFEQPKIYLVKDGWLESFPDSIVQFGRMLRKKGGPIHIADDCINRYVLAR